MTFADLDTLFEAARLPRPEGSRKRAVLTVEKFHALAAKEVPCGYFTLTLTDGSRRRFRIRVERGSFAVGQRTLSIYRKMEVEPDPVPHEERTEHEWEALAIVSATGFNLFKRWRSEWEGRWALAIWSLVHGRELAGYSLEVEPRCWLTMRELKDEDAKRTGLCKVWRKRFGIE